MSAAGETIREALRIANDANGCYFDLPFAALDALESELAALRVELQAARSLEQSAARQWVKAEAALQAAREALRDPEKIARLFHEAYERLAPSFGYETRRDSAVPWESLPLMNKRLMIAVAEEVARAVLVEGAPACGHRSPLNYDRTRWATCTKPEGHEGLHADDNGARWADNTMPSKSFGDAGASGGETQTSGNSVDTSTARASRRAEGGDAA